MNKIEAIEQLRQMLREQQALLKYDIAEQDIRPTLLKNAEALHIALKILDIDRLPYIFIRGKLPSLNDYVNACRSNAHAGATMKKDFENLIIYQLAKMPRINEPVKVHFEWHEKNHKRDMDNVAFAKKFIFDAMQKAGKIANDDSRHIIGFSDDFVYGDDYGVKIRIERCGE